MVQWFKRSITQCDTVMVTIAVGNNILHQTPTSLSFLVILDNVLELLAIPSEIISSCFNRKPCANLQRRSLYQLDTVWSKCMQIFLQRLEE